MTDESKLATALSTTLKSDETKALVAEYAEVGLDQLLADGLAKDIPLVGTLVSLTKIGLTIHDQLFAKKLLKMLGPFAAVGTTERAGMIDRLENDPKYGRKVGEHLIELLDRVEAHRKPLMISAIFLAYQRRKIDAEMLHRLTHAVDRIPLFDIDELRPLLAEEKLVDENDPIASLQNLLYAGLVKINSLWDGDKYSVNEVGNVFLMLNLDQLK